ncbi:MAG: hypothetical protein ABR905_06170 [Terracidiphilus sp.]|jgi:hypothetical protein
MRARGYFELTTTELPDELRFTVVHHDGWINLIAVPVTFLFPIFVLWQAWVLRNTWRLVLCALILALSLSDIRRTIAKWLHGNTENLSIKRSGIKTTGNLGRLLLTQLAVSASELTGPGYGLEGGRQYGVPKALEYNDFYLKRGRKSFPILRGLNQEQKKNVSDLILQRFPEVFTGSSGPASILFGDHSGVANLGLSDAGRDGTDTQP